MRFSPVPVVLSALLIAGCTTKEDHKAQPPSDKAAQVPPDAPAVAAAKPVGRWKADRRRIKDDVLELDPSDATKVTKSDTFHGEFTKIEWRRNAKDWKVVFRGTSPCLDGQTTFKGRKGGGPPSDDQVCFISTGCHNGTGQPCKYTYDLVEPTGAPGDPDILIEDGALPPPPDEIDRLRKLREQLKNQK